MRRYMFYTGGYTEQFHVMADDKEAALQYLEKYLIEQDIKQCKINIPWADIKEFVFPNSWTYPNGRKVYFVDFQDWAQQEGYYIRQLENLTKPESIFEFDVGEVSQTEVA